MEKQRGAIRQETLLVHAGGLGSFLRGVDRLSLSKSMFPLALLEEGEKGSGGCNADFPALSPV